MLRFNVFIVKLDEKFALINARYTVTKVIWIYTSFKRVVIALNLVSMDVFYNYKKITAVSKGYTVT